MKVKLIQNENNKKRIPNKANGLIVEINKINKAGNFVLKSWNSRGKFYNDRMLKKSDFEVIFEFDYRRMGNDLYVDCSCPICSCDKGDGWHYNRIKLSGYNDHYFFNEVNKDFRKYTCNKCDTEYEYRWTTEGVIMRFKED